MLKVPRSLQRKSLRVSGYALGLLKLLTLVIESYGWKTAKVSFESYQKRYFRTITTLKSFVR